MYDEISSVRLNISSDDPDRNGGTIIGVNGAPNITCKLSFFFDGIEFSGIIIKAHFCYLCTNKQ